MKTAINWCIRITKTGEPAIVFTDDTKFHSTKVLKPLSDDITVKSTGLSFQYRDKDVDYTEYCCPFSKLSYPKIPTPIEKLEAYPLVSKAEPHILYFMYEFVTGVVIQKHSPFNRKTEIDVFDVIDLLDKYKVQPDKVGGVDFDTVIGLIQ